MINEEIFSEYIADPAAIRAADTSILEAAIEKYPYCQLLHAFHVKSLSGNSDIPQDLLFKAALLSPDRKVLWKIIHQGESIRDKNAGIKSASLLAAAAAELELNKEEEIIEGLDSSSDQTNNSGSNLDQQNAVAEDAASINPDVQPDLHAESDPQVAENIVVSVNAEPENRETLSEQTTTISEDQDRQDSKELQEILDNEVQNKPVDEESSEIKTAESIHQEGTNDRAAEEIGEILESEVSDPTETTVGTDLPTAESIHQEEERDSASTEIQDILTPDQHVDRNADETTDSSEKALFVPDFTEADTVNISENDVDIIEEQDLTDHSTEIGESQDLDNLINAGIAQNYSLTDESADEQADNTITTVAETSETQDVARYTDDKMPYSFLWWLDKTRREHTQNYQPYASNFKLDTSKSINRNAVDPLSSQIIENIFHLQSPVDQLENSPRTVAFQIKRKGDYILEKFIREEPQIKPPDSQKLDTENKARKSSEDPNDLVSETLAQIYTDQMLYHKAIETFKKLSLKFPEKSTYFADQIIELEKKLN